ncbi:MAG: hypothetical protein ACI8TP_003613 [Acidimicrobiales bacterium]|jgi:hypothetical protein
MRNPLVRLFALLMALALVAAACGGSSSDDASADADTDADAETDADADADADESAGVDLSGVCPANVVFQTDWNPESEHGSLYELVGKDGYELDANNFVVKGDLVAGGEATGVTVEVRSGGPAVGFQPVEAVAFADTDITLFYMNSDAAYNNSEEFPTLSVMAPLDKNPQIIMWDPETYDVDTIADLPDDTTIRIFGGSTYASHLTSAGIVKPEQIDESYDGTPAIFISEAGAIAQQGFASAEPYVYKNEVPEWGKDVNYQLIHDTGWEIYAAALAIRADEKEELAPCLELLIPVIQQAQVDYINNPAATNALIVEAVEANNNGWIYTEGVADFSVQAQLDNGLVGNGGNSTLGDFDFDRMEKFYEILGGVFPDVGPLTPEDLMTNEFIDTSIGL